MSQLEKEKNQVNTIIVKNINNKKEEVNNIHNRLMTILYDVDNLDFYIDELIYCRNSKN